MNSDLFNLAANPYLGRSQAAYPWVDNLATLALSQGHTEHFQVMNSYFGGPKISQLMMLENRMELIKTKNCKKQQIQKLMDNEIMYQMKRPYQEMFSVSVLL